MCYPKPGPRCSNHARIAFSKARYALKETFPRTDEVKLQFVEAELQFHMTPAGMRELERLIREKVPHTQDSRFDPAERLAYCKEARKQALADLKAKDKGDLPHPNKYNYDLLTQAEQTVFQKASVSRNGWATKEDQTERVNQYLEYSSSWVDTLTPEEIQAARWMTSAGSIEFAEYVSGNLKPSSFDIHQGETLLEKKVRVEKAMASLDTALAKFSGTEQIVYRGASEYFFPANIRETQYTDGYEENFEGFLSGLKAKGTVEFNNYQSASLDPATACDFSKQDTIFEMKTKRSVPVGVASAWQGSEREMIIPRDTKFRIVGILKNVPYQLKTAEANAKPDLYDMTLRRVTVIQMEEIVG